MYSSISIPRFSLSSSNSQQYRLTSLERDFRVGLTLDFVSTVFVRKQFNDTGLGRKRQKGK